MGNNKRWIPTHQIRTSGVETPVMLSDDGAAYTKDEWDTTSPADYERRDGQWLFQGQAFNGTVQAIKAPQGEPLYYVAFQREDGKWDIVNQFTAESDEAANAYAEDCYGNEEWFVLDLWHNNING